MSQSNTEKPDMLAFEVEQWNKGCSRVAGVDEAGRGPLVGSVVAAAVVFRQEFAVAEIKESLAGLTDSKQISEKKRELFFKLLQADDSIDIGVGIAAAAEIDKINILKATHLAMKRAVENLAELPEHILVDGRPVPGLPAPSTSIVKGDARSLSIAAASIIAKVTRDRMLYELDAAYPEYGFASHKGYGTKAHLAALKKYGPIAEHRQSFRPVREAGAVRYTQMELI
jgi:ribonuclease HII